MPSISNYNYGFPGGLTVRGMPIQQVHPGKVFWVNNTSVLADGGVGGSDGNPGTSPQKPFRTLDYAIGRCMAGRGDIIMVAPGHTETITAAGTITLDVNGVCIFGLGVGAQRPTITYTTANTASLSWTGDGCTIKNVNFVGNFLSVAAPILNSGGRDWTVEGNDFSDTDATHGLLSCVTTTVSTNSDNGWFCGNTRSSDATTTPGTAVKVLNTTNRLTIKDNILWHSVAENNAAALLDHGALVVNELMMENNHIYSINTAQTTDGFLIKTSATTGSGIIARNFVRSQDPSAAIMVTATAVQYGPFENYHTGETTFLSGDILPARGADGS